MLPDGLCGKPAVEFIEESDGRFYLCSEHWDEFGDMSDGDVDDFNEL